MATGKYCKHSICREDTALELAWMGARLFRKDLLQLSTQAHASTVRCRLHPRKGPVHAPFPPRRARRSS